MARVRRRPWERGEAEELSALIETRKVVPPAAAAAIRKAVGSRPKTDESLERRRRWTASGRLPPVLAARFTPGEIAVLAVVAADGCRLGDCRLAVSHLAAVAGVSETLVRNALREARALGLVTIEEWRVTAWRNDTNVIRIVSAEWSSWLKLAKERPCAAPASQGFTSLRNGRTVSAEDLALRIGAVNLEDGLQIEADSANLCYERLLPMRPKDLILAQRYPSRGRPHHHAQSITAFSLDVTSKA